MTDPGTDPGTGPAPDPAAALPERIGPYRILRKLGAGGMATVYAGQQEQPRRTVAVKVMRDLPEPEQSLRRFRREIEILGKLRHAYIAQVYEAGLHEDGLRRVPYYVMEYVPGAKTIVQYAEYHRLALRDRIKLFVKVCAAIEHGHQLRIIHRDIKPANILIDERGEPKVIDFGIARGSDLDPASLTMTGDDGRLVGTMQYMAPEQLHGAPVDLDARCDVYALGAVLYRLLTRRRHHDLAGLPILRAAQIVQEEDPDAPSRLRPELKGDLETILRKALDRDPARRYRTAGSLGRDLLRYLADQPIHARPASRIHRARLFARRHRPAVIASAISVGILIVASIGLVVQHAMLTRVRDRAAIPLRDGPAAAPDDGADAASPVADRAPVDDRAPIVFARSGPVPTRLAYSADGRRIAASAEDALIVFDVERREIIAETRDHDEPIETIMLSADGTRVLTTASDEQLVVVDADGGALVSRIRPRLGPLRGVAFAPDGATIAIATNDLLVHLLRIDGTERLVLRGTRGGFGALAFDASAERLAGVTDQGAILVWAAGSGAPLAVLDGPQPAADRLVFTPAGGLLAIAPDGAGAHWADPEGDPRSRPFTTAPAGVHDPCAGWRVEPGSDGWRRHDPDDPAAAQSIIPFATPGAATLSPDGRWAAVAYPDGAIRLEPVRVLEATADRPGGASPAPGVP